MPHTEPLTGLDAAFLALDGPSTPMHMGAVGVFQPTDNADIEQIWWLLAQRAEAIPRLRLRLRETWLPPGSAQWERDPVLDVERHIRVRRAPTTHDPALLSNYASEWITEPLPRDAPPWQLDVLTGLPGGQFALLLKLHHALTDGAGAVRVASGLFDGMPPQTDVPPPQEPAGRSWRDQVDDVVRRARNGWDVVRATRPLHSSPLAAFPSAARRLAFVRIDAADLRVIRKRHGGTPNDVALAVLSGALRSWLRWRGERVDDLTLRALIPVSLRSRMAGASNRLSGYLCDLPIGVASPLGRLAQVRECMDRNKSAGPQAGPGTLPLLANQVPVPLHRLLTGFIGVSSNALFDTTVTNVPLPGIPLRVGGARLSAAYPVVPLAPGQAIGVAVTPYRDAVHIGFNANADAAPDIGVLAEAVEKETAILHELCS
ncbi:wax ester/triacylglycerol synthase domain-containing protein [Haloechinothrix halophila]|uniref:wax ester/triacylglycerol synthase domain-containing protein n=1 Tax=Haloechinothrix halophila TaxID=1069073 RepID=UPI00041FD9C0|nr:wax ester/triacylglycerol synthase domain-containing protein [Haloechinothrix halophila]